MAGALDGVYRDPAALAAYSRLMTKGGGQPLSMVDAARMVEMQKQSDAQAQIQQNMPAIVDKLKGLSREQAFQLLVPQVGMDNAITIMKQLYPQASASKLPTGYQLNPETGQAELIPGVDPSYRVKSSPQSFDDQMALLDAREAKKAANRAYDDASSPVSSTSPYADLKGDDLLNAIYRDTGQYPYGRKPGGKQEKKTGGITVGDKTFTDADIAETAKKYGMTEDEVRRRIGAK